MLVCPTDLKMGSILVRPKYDDWRNMKAGTTDAWYEKHPPRKCRLVRTPKGMKASWLTQPCIPLLGPLEKCDFVLSDFGHGTLLERSQHIFH